MGHLPPGFFVAIVVTLSALAGALLTWLISDLAGSSRRGATVEDSQDEDVNRHDLLRVIRSKSGPIVIVQGKRVRHLREIRDRETGQETIEAVKAVLSFAEGWLPALQRKKVSARPPEDALAAASRLSNALPRMTPTTGAGSDDASTSRPLRLVEEINALIQKRLQERPDLAKQRIKLTRDVHGHPLIYVGQQQYRSADEIPNAEVRAFIQNTIQVWEDQ